MVGGHAGEEWWLGDNLKSLKNIETLIGSPDVGSGT
jgi:hypothetical protein